MALQSEGRHDLEGLISEANGHRSRENMTVLSGENLRAMEVVGIVTASGKVAQHNPGAADGRETAAGVLLYAVDASAGDTPGVVLRRDAEVRDSALQFINGIAQGDRDDAVAALEGLGIQVR